MNQKQKLLELIDQYAEARHIQGHSTYNIKTAAARREVEDELERALSGVGKTVAWALKVGEELHSVSRFELRATSIPQNAVVIPLTSNQLGPVDPDIAKKSASNTWNHFGEILPTLKKISRGEWFWGNNSRCKYVEIRLDTRDGGCILYDRDRVRISPEQFAHQIEPVSGFPAWKNVQLETGSEGEKR